MQLGVSKKPATITKKKKKSQIWRTCQNSDCAYIREHFVHKVDQDTVTGEGSADTVRHHPTVNTECGLRACS